MSVSILMAALAGIISAYIVNYLADVLPYTRRFSKPACQHCGEHHTITDYILFKRCRQCGKARSLRTWLLIPTLTGIAVYLAYNPKPEFGFALSIAIVIYMALVFVIDMEHRAILHETSIFASFLGLGAGYANNGLVSTLTGGLAGFGIMLAFYYFGVLFTRWRARRMERQGLPADDEDALGYGDVILSGIIGLLLGAGLIWFGILLAVLLGGLVGGLIVLVMLIVKKYDQNALMTFIPYGPFLLLSAFSILFLPDYVRMLLPG